MKTTTLGELMPSEYGPASNYFEGAQELSYLWGGNADTMSNTIAPFNDYSYNVIKSVFTYDTKYHNLRTSYSFNLIGVSNSPQNALFNNFHMLALESGKYPVVTGYFNLSSNATVIPYSATAITTCGVDTNNSECYTQVVFAGTRDGSAEIEVYQRNLSVNNAPAEWNSTTNPEDFDDITVTYFCSYNAADQAKHVILLNKLNTYNSAVSITGPGSFKKLTTDSSSSDILTALSPKLHIKDSRGTVGTQISSVSDFEKALTYCKVTYNSANQPTAYGIPLYGRSLSGQIQVIYDGHNYKFDGFTSQLRLTSTAYTGPGSYSYIVGIIYDDIIWATALSISGENISVSMPYAETSIRYNNFKSTLGSINKLEAVTTESGQDDIISALDMRVNYSSFLDFAPGTWYSSYTELYKIQSVLLALQDAATNGKGFVFADTGSKINVSKMSMTINSVQYNLCWQLSGEEWINIGSDYKLYNWYMVLAYYNGALKCVKGFTKNAI